MIKYYQNTPLPLTSTLHYTASRISVDLSFSYSVPQSVARRWVAGGIK